MTKIKDLLSCRRVLSLMVILCFMFQYMLKVNISIAVVAMTQTNSSNQTNDSLLFSWNEEQKNEILGCFFWGYLITTIPGGRLSEIYGAKIVLGTSMFLASILTLLTPLAFSLHYYGAIAVRVLIGLALGVFFPSLPSLVAKWIPPKDRSKFMSHSAAGYLGTALTLQLCGVLIAQFDWPSVFYVTGTIALVWSMAWFYLIYDSPGQHPRISLREIEKLMSEIKVHEIGTKTTIPWMKLLTSKPVHAIIAANAFFLYSLFFILSELPSYMKQVLGFKIETNGLLSSLPYVATYFAAVLSCYLADKWNKSKTFSLLTIRKTFTSLALFGPAVLFLIASFWGYNSTVSIVVFTLSIGLMGCFPAGFYSNCLDIAPAFAGTIFGIGSAFGSLAGYLSTKILAYVTRKEQTFEQWRYIFWILVGINVVGGTIYLMLASAKLQSWNPKSNEAEMIKLKGKPQIKC